MARIETMDSLMARLGRTKPTDGLDRVGRDMATLTRRMDAGELPTDLDAAIVNTKKLTAALSRMYRPRRKGR